MFLIAGSLLVIVLTGSMFVICPSAQYSCQVTQAVSLVFGLIGLVFLLVGIVDWREQKQKDKAKPDRPA